jgi:Kef-type K+ transport system membrane component KefB
MSLFLIAVAIVGKVVTGFAVFGQPGINRLAIGVGMIPRGEVGLVFASFGATTGVLSDALQAAIIVMVILTTFLAPPLLRVVFSQQETVASESAGLVEGLQVAEPSVKQSEES